MEQWIFYDGQCGACTRGIYFWRGTFERRGFKTAALQEPWLAERLKMTPVEVAADFRVLASDGRVLVGSEGYRHLMRSIWWAWPLAMVLGLPGLKQGFAALYRAIRKRRYGIAGRCEIGALNGNGFTTKNTKSTKNGGEGGKFSGADSMSRSRSSHWSQRRDGWHPAGWLPLVVFVVTVLVFRAALEPWQLMWLLAIGFFAGFKWWTFFRAERRGVSRRRQVGYLLLWPGMNAGEFLRGRVEQRARRGEWLAAGVKIGLGAALIFGLARMCAGASELGAAWIAGAGYVLLLHCGLFHFLGLIWRRNGVDARRIMNSPLRATSLAELWGSRWNTAFSDLGKEFVIRPLSPRIGAGGAMLLTFFISGLMHELLISVPVNAGYGLPTAYFTLQGLVMALQRSRYGRMLRFKNRFAGWAFVLLVAAGPAYWLFHPAFMQGVFAPFLKVVGAL